MTDSRSVIGQQFVRSVEPCDWTTVSKRMWQWSTNWWDKAGDIYSQVVPEFILEFDTYEKTNECGYDGALNEEDYIEITSLLLKATGGKRNDELYRVLYLPAEFGNECEGTGAEAAKEIVCDSVRNRRTAKNRAFDCLGSEFLSVEVFEKVDV